MDEKNIDELVEARLTITELAGLRVSEAIHHLRILKEKMLNSIPEKKRQSQGITWVLQRISDMLTEECDNDDQIKVIALSLTNELSSDDILKGVPIFMMGEYGKAHPIEVFDFFADSANSKNWVVREFAQAGFRTLLSPNKEFVYTWLKGNALSGNPFLRRFVGETLRPVTVNRWMNKEPEYSLSILRLMFRESHPYPRTSVGNNLSDLSRRNPELIFTIVQELVEIGDRNSDWIAHRTCRNLVKQNPMRVMDILKMNEYHYKDRNYSR